MQANISVSFFEDSSIKPRFIIKFDDSTFDLRNKRWVQFLVLLTYRQLTNSNNGWVTLEDVSFLSTFRRLKHKSIGKYISESIVGLPFKLQYFIKNNMNDINTTGPYKLLITPPFINADESKIEAYLKQISKGTPPMKNANHDLWEASIKTFSDFNLDASREFTTEYIKRTRNSANHNFQNLAVAYIRLAEIERRCNIKNLNFNYLLEKAKQPCSSIKLPGLESLIHAYILSTHALITDKNKRNIKLTTKLINESLDLIQSDKDYEEDRLCLLAGRYYHQSHILLRKGDKRNSQDAFVKAMKNYRRMDECGRPKIVNCEPGIIEGSTLQNILMQRVRNVEHYGNEELCWYYEMMKNREVSGYLTLSIGKWLSESIIVTHEYDEAVEFLSECLISHADLHETKIYQRMVAKYRECKKIVQK